MDALGLLGYACGFVLLPSRMCTDNYEKAYSYQMPLVYGVCPLSDAALSVLPQAIYGHCTLIIIQNVRMHDLILHFLNKE